MDQKFDPPTPYFFILFNRVGVLQEWWQKSDRVKRMRAENEQSRRGKGEWSFCCSVFSSDEQLCSLSLSLYTCKLFDCNLLI